MRRKIDLFILLLVLMTGFFAVRNARLIGDWWHSQQYSPPQEISKLADDAGMSNKGKQLFFRFSPQLVGQQDLDSYCDIEKLGCAEGRNIYILQYINNEEYNQSTVTAAHEMLHVAFSRLKPAQKEMLQPLLKAELDKPQAANIIKKLKDYPPEDYFNESHSFIGSELGSISPELSNYYKDYFNDRSKSTSAYNASPR
ncbi:MAG: hypothetical protein V4702_00315 [Patescibacteria group bacterium]